MSEDRDIVNKFYGTTMGFKAFDSNCSTQGYHFGTYEDATYQACLELSKLPSRELRKLEANRCWKGQIVKVAIMPGRVKWISATDHNHDWRIEISKAMQSGNDSIVYSADIGLTRPATRYLIWNLRRIRVLTKSCPIRIH